MSKVLIVLLNFNNEMDTIDCLGSLKDLRDAEYKIVLIDNASRNFNKGDLYYYCLENDVDIIENENNLGFGAGNNVILTYKDINEYDWLWFLNNDTIVEKDSLKKMVSLGESVDNVGAVGCKVVYFDSLAVQSIGGGYIKKNIIPRHVQKIENLASLQYITGASALIKREVFQQLNGFNEEYFMYWEDVDLSFRIRGRGYLLVTAVDAIIRHKESATADSKSLFFFYHFFRSAAIFFRGKANYKFITFSIYFTIKSFKDGNLLNSLKGLFYNIFGIKYDK